MKVFLHFGLQKTGTTVFQQEIFGRFEGISSYDRPSLRPLLQDFLLNDTTKILISDESMFGKPPIGKNYTGDNTWLTDQTTSLKKIGELDARSDSLQIFPMLSLRRHGELLRSLYKQHLHQGGTIDLEGEFFDRKENRGLIRPKDLRFAARIRAVQSSFSTDPFLFLKEELDDNFSGLMKDLADFLGEPIPDLERKQLQTWNRGVRRRQAGILKTLNRLLPHRYSPGPESITSKILRRLGLSPRAIAQNKLDFLGDEDLNYSEEYQTFIEDYYADDWQYTLDTLEETRDRIDVNDYR